MCIMCMLKSLHNIDRASVNAEMTFALAKSVMGVPAIIRQQYVAGLLETNNSKRNPLTAAQFLARAALIAEAPGTMAIADDGTVAVLDFFGPDDNSVWVEVPTDPDTKRAMLAAALGKRDEARDIVRNAGNPTRGPVNASVLNDAQTAVQEMLANVGGTKH